MYTVVYRLSARVPFQWTPYFWGRNFNKVWGGGQRIAPCAALVAMAFLEAGVYRLPLLYFVKWPPNKLEYLRPFDMYFPEAEGACMAWWCCDVVYFMLNVIFHLRNSFSRGYRLNVLRWEFLAENMLKMRNFLLHCRMKLFSSRKLKEFRDTKAGVMCNGCFPVEMIQLKRKHNSGMTWSFSQL